MRLDVIFSNAVRAPGKLKLTTTPPPPNRSGSAMVIRDAGPPVTLHPPIPAEIGSVTSSSPLVLAPKFTYALTGFDCRSATEISAPPLISTSRSTSRTNEPPTMSASRKPTLIPVFKAAFASAVRFMLVRRT